jgi:hypothetical protein
MKCRDSVVWTALLTMAESGAFGNITALITPTLGDICQNVRPEKDRLERIKHEAHATTPNRLREWLRLKHALRCWMGRNNKYSITVT